MVKVQDDGGKKKGVTPLTQKEGLRKVSWDCTQAHEDVTEYCYWGILNDAQIGRRMKGDEAGQANRDIDVEVTRTCYKVHICILKLLGSISRFCKGRRSHDILILATYDVPTD